MPESCSRCTKTWLISDKKEVKLESNVVKCQQRASSSIRNTRKCWNTWHLFVANNKIYEYNGAAWKFLETFHFSRKQINWSTKTLLSKLSIRQARGRWSSWWKKKKKCKLRERMLKQSRGESCWIKTREFGTPAFAYSLFAGKPQTFAKFRKKKMGFFSRHVELMIIISCNHYFFCFPKEVPTRWMSLLLNLDGEFSQILRGPLNTVISIE